MMYCVDILDALTRDFFARKGNAIETETVELSEGQLHHDRPGYEPISSTLWRQREHFCARRIQAMWRANVKQKIQARAMAEENNGAAFLETKVHIVNEVDRLSNSDKISDSNSATSNVATSTMPPV
jgi:hypothetical protein